MANPQIRIIDLPQDTNVAATIATDYIPLESTAEGGRKVTVYDFLSTAGVLVFYPLVAGGGTSRAIATFNSSTSAFYDNPHATIDNTGTITALGFKATSSQRFKHNIQGLFGATELVKRLRGVSFYWNEDSKRDIGLIAEEVAPILPEIVGYDEQGQVCSVDYSKIVPILINSIKELTERIETLERK